MRIRALVLTSIVAASLAGVVWAESPRDSAGDYFVAAVMNAQRDPVVVTGGEARGQGGRAFLLPNDGAATWLVVGCEESCRSVAVNLSAAGLQPISAMSTRDNNHSVTLRIPPNYTHSLSNFEARINLSCERGEGCNYRWALLGGGGDAPTLAQRGMRAAPSDAEWNAAAPAGAALRWLSRPSGDDLRYFYPIQAWNANRSGSAQLQCIVGADGTLRCRAHNETPSGAGFGDAARRLSSLLRAETTDAVGQPTANRQVIIPVQFSRG